MTDLEREPTSRPACELTPGRLAEFACILEVTARKPGNVHRELDLQGLHLLDFLLSAGAIVEPLNRSRELGLGQTVLEAVEATRRVVQTNTNLGTILLLAPLCAVGDTEELFSGAARVVAAAGIEDARKVYRAIRLAHPGGMGRVARQDLSEEPTVPLQEAMSLAKERDMIARQYDNGFQELRDEALPELKRHLDEGQPLETAIQATFLRLLANHPDSLIVRKFGIDLAAEVSRRAGEILAAGWPSAGRSPNPLPAFDAWLRRRQRPLNPGTTADLIAATLFVALREGLLRLPRLPGSASWSRQGEEP